MRLLKEPDFNLPGIDFPSLWEGLLSNSIHWIEMALANPSLDSILRKVDTRKPKGLGEQA